MFSVEKTWAIASCELKLLVRSRGKFLAVICAPLVAGAFFGMEGGGTESLLASHGLLFVLLLSALYLASEAGAAEWISALIPVQARRIVYAARLLALAIVLVIQAALYSGIIAFLEPKLLPGLGTIAAVLAASLVLGSAFQLMEHGLHKLRSRHFRKEEFRT